VTGALRPLIAFVGPSIPRDEAERLCPGLDLRPPARRDDLYREREKGAWGFLLIDGVFMQDDAVSPREVVDVLGDGALFIGAASMGALRAADCWPAGARGVGLIYRLYRLGLLESDEDVAVAVSADGSDTAVSVPLVNVRYAVSRAVRRRLLDRATARRIVSAAAAIYYSERTWREVLRRVDPLPGDVVDFCTRLDLKREDARRALSHAAHVLRDAESLARAHGRLTEATFARSEVTRERRYDATGGANLDLLRSRLLDWLIGSGRLARYLPVSAWPAAPTAADLDALARSIWSDLKQANQLDAELMRLLAVERAVADGPARTPRADDVRLAQAEIANRHGFRSWDRLLASPRGRQYAAQIVAAQARMVAAKRMREAWGRPSASSTGSNGAAGSMKRAREKLRALLARRPSGG
jgi:hypothetical protein